MPDETTRKLTEREKALYADLVKNGPVLLWSGDGKIPGNFRGLVPTTLSGYLETITLELRAIRRKLKEQG